MTDYDDIPDEVLDGTEDVDRLIDEAQSADNLEPADLEQDTMLTYMLQNSYVWSQCSPAIKPEYFLPEYRPVIKFVKQYHKEYGNLPPLRIIKSETKVNFSIVDDAERPDVQEYILEQADKFFGSQEFLLYASEIAEAFEKSKGHLSKKNISGFISKGRDVVNVSIKRDPGVNVFTDLEEYLKMDEEFGSVSTGFGFLDKALSGGVSMPSMNIVSGASGHGKSIMLMNIAANYAAAGFNVAYYSLELEKPLLARRWSAILTNTDIDLVHKHRSTVLHQLRSSSKESGTIIMHKFPMKGTTMGDIEAHYKDLQMNHDKEFRVMCIDYMDLLSPMDTRIDRSNIHIKDKDISQDMNDFFHENNIIGWTASQQTKTAVDEKELKSSKVAGGADKVNTCDNLLMLRRNEEEKEEGIFWIIIRKARSSIGNDAKIPMKWNSRTQRMSDGDNDIFIRENPFLFGKLSKDVKKDQGISKTVTNDAIAKEAGVIVTKEKEATGKQKNASDIRSRIGDTFRKGKK